MTTISSKQAKQTIADNIELIQEYKDKLDAGGLNLLARNNLKTKIKNRETINKSLEQFIKKPKDNE